MNAGLSEFMSDDFDQLPAEPRHTRPDPCIDQGVSQPNSVSKSLFVSASHQTGLDIRSMTRRSNIVGIRGGEGLARAEALTLLDYVGHRYT